MVLRIQKEMTTTKLWEAKDKVDITLQQHLQVRFKVSRIFLAFLKDYVFTISELQENLVKLQMPFYTDYFQRRHESPDMKNVTN